MRDDRQGSCSRNQAHQVPPAAHRAVQCLGERRTTGGQTQAQHDARDDQDRAIRTDRLLRYQRRLDQRKALSLAARFEVLRNGGLSLLGAQLGVLGARVIVVTGQLTVFLFDLRPHRDLVLKVLQLLPQPSLLLRQRIELRPGRGELRLDLDVGRIVSAAHPV